jgi:RNA-binding protein
MLTSKQRAYLRGLGQSCPAIMQIGKGGITENLIKTVSDALEARELVKLSVLESSQFSGDERKESINNDIVKYKATLDELTQKSDSSAKVLAKYENSLNEIEFSFNKISKLKILFLHFGANFKTSFKEESSSLNFEAISCNNFPTPSEILSLSTSKFTKSWNAFSL